MKRRKKYMDLLLALLLCLSLTACGRKITIRDLEGYWYPADGIGSSTSILTCFYIDGTSETWEEYDQYGDLTGNAGKARVEGDVLRMVDVPWVGDVEIPIGDADTLVTDTGETYWVKGDRDFMEKPEMPIVSGCWYYQGDQDSEYATILTLYEDGTYTRGDAEEGTYTYNEFEETVAETGATVFRQEITLSGGFMEENYYLVSNGQVLVYWADDGDNYYVYEDALGNEHLLLELSLTNGSFSGEYYSLQFNRDYTMRCDFFDGVTEALTGTWELNGDTVTIFWDEGEMEEATLSLDGEKTLWMNSTGETLENPW